MAVLLASSLFACATLADEEIARDRVALGVFRALLSMSRCGFGAGEEAAFLIRTAHGIAFLHWPQSFNRHETMYAGPVPAGTIAIIHTHPGWLPMPSNVDARTSRLTGLPVYVITFSMISKTTGKSATVVSKGWNR